MRFPPDRAGWLVVTRNYRLAVGVLIGVVLLALSSALHLVLTTARHRPLQWFDVVVLIVTGTWAVRMAGNVLWLRRGNS